VRLALGVERVPHVEHRPTGEQLDRHRAERVQVGPRAQVPGVTPELLRRHRGRGPGDDAASGVGVHELGQPEVRQHHGRAAFVAAEQGVGALEVQVDHTPGVGVGQGVEQGGEDRPHPGPREPAPDRLEGAPFGELHREPRVPTPQLAVRRGFGLGAQRPRAQHPGDVGVIEDRHRADLGEEQLRHPRAVVAPRQHLDRDPHAVLVVPPPPDVADRAPPELAGQVERARGHGGAQPAEVLQRPALAHGLGAVPQRLGEAQGRPPQAHGARQLPPAAGPVADPVRGALGGAVERVEQPRRPPGRGAAPARDPADEAGVGGPGDVFGDQGERGEHRVRRVVAGERREGGEAGGPLGPPPEGEQRRHLVEARGHAAGAGPLGDLGAPAMGPRRPLEVAVERVGSPHERPQASPGHRVVGG
jgi:hypothetical protein